MQVTFLARRELAHPMAGGSEVLVDRLACGMAQRGHQVELLCGGPTAPRAYPVSDMGGTYGPFLRAPLRTLARHRRSDLVVDVINGMPFFSPLWRRRPVLSLVNHVHLDQWALWFSPPQAAVGRWIEGQLMPAIYRRQRFVAVSASTAAGLMALGIPAEQISVVHNGVDPRPSQLMKSRLPLFVALGRLVPQKRFDLLLRLWEQVRPLTGGRLVIAGDGPERNRLRAMAGPDASLPGWLSEEAKQELLGDAWLLLHPAMMEGWGLVVMEGAAHATPAVCFDAPGVRDSVVHGETGLLAGSEDELAQAWVGLATDDRARAALGEQARRRADAFSWSLTVQRFAQVAEAVVAGRSPVLEPMPPSMSPLVVPRPGTAAP